MQGVQLLAIFIFRDMVYNTNMQDQSIGIIPVRKHGKNGNSYEFFVIHQTMGHWAFPKGHKIGNETEQETAQRELREETGISKCRLADDFRVIDKYSFEENGEKIDKEVIFFLGFVEKSPDQAFVQNDETQNGKWLSFQDALLQLTFPESRQTLIKAQNYLAQKRGRS